MTIEFLTFLVITHAIFCVAGSLFIVSYSFGYNFPILDFLVLANVVSFIVFRRCIMIDIYNYFANGKKNLPDRAKDNYPRILFNKLLGKTKNKRDLTPLRLDIIQNIKPFVNTSNVKKINTFLNRKIEYTSINILLTVLLITKYRLNFLLPVLFVWILYNFRT